MSIDSENGLIWNLEGSSVALGHVQERLRAVPPRRPFDEAVIAFCSDFSRRLGRATRDWPELTALAFWMRKSQLRRMQESFRALGTDETMLAPRGIVFHVPPSNVDTIFIYSWLLSLLVGNKNIVRLSSRESAVVDLILDVVAETLADGHASIGAQTTFVRYGHDAAITEALSAQCDLRMIWGGDATVRTIRQAPLSPHAVDLTFPDRSSMAAIKVDAYLALGEDDRHALVAAFFNDAYWFDQMGCSSPRVLHWVGCDEDSARASSDFYPRLSSEVRSRGYTVDTSLGIRKMTYAYQAALDLDVVRLKNYGNEVSVVELREPSPPDDFVGAGTFFDARISGLEEISDIVVRRDQTLSQFGFSSDELRSFASSVNGRGIDRIVPIGQALTFNRYWDGYDLLQELTRRVYIQGAAARP